MKLEDYYASEIKKYGGTKEYVIAKAKEKKKLINLIIKYAKGGRILEAGSGTASNSIFLANRGFEVVCIDKDKNIIKLSKKISKKFKRKPTFVNKNILNLKPKEEFSVVFSHGVLEHFADEEIIRLINKELQLGKIVIFSVPSDFFKEREAINGDERFLSRKKWRQIIKQTNGEIIRVFSYFYDPDRLSVRLLKLLSKLTYGILPTKKPYMGFVLRARCLLY